MRSLFHGVPAGLSSTDVDGKTVFLLSEVPYELEPIIYRWLMGQPAQDRREWLHYDTAGVPSLTTEGWEKFVEWMLSTLTAAQNHD
jgi:hypothetical protein